MQSALLFSSSSLGFNFKGQKVGMEATAYLFGTMNATSEEVPDSEFLRNTFRVIWTLTLGKSGWQFFECLMC